MVILNYLIMTTFESGPVLGSLFVLNGVYGGYMKSKIELQVYENLHQIVENENIELADVEFKKLSGQDNLTLFLFSESGITLNDCENIHNLVNPVLDELDPTEDKPYTLNVSSLGLDRAFKTNRDFERYLNKQIELKFYKAFEGKKIINGNLVDFDDNKIVLNIDNKNKEFDKKIVAVARPHVEF